MTNFIIKTLSTRVTPLAYLVALQGIVYGTAFTFFSSSPGVQNTILFKDGALVGVTIWGEIALISAITLFVGMFVKSKIATGAGSLGMFLVWTFAAIIYITGGYFYLLFPLAVLNMMAHGYFYLASSLDRLWDYTPLDIDTLD